MLFFIPFIAVGIVILVMLAISGRKGPDRGAPTVVDLANVNHDVLPDGYDLHLPVGASIVRPRPFLPPPSKHHWSVDIARVIAGCLGLFGTVATIVLMSAHFLKPAHDDFLVLLPVALLIGGAITLKIMSCRFLWLERLFIDEQGPSFREKIAIPQSWSALLASEFKTTIEFRSMDIRAMNRDSQDLVLEVPWSSVSGASLSGFNMRLYLTDGTVFLIRDFWLGDHWEEFTAWILERCPELMAAEVKHCDYCNGRFTMVDVSPLGRKHVCRHCKPEVTQALKEGCA
jgi:hypothetical protein